VTVKTLYPAEAESVALLLPNAPPEVANGSAKVFAVVDDTMEPHGWHECRTDNNTSGAASGLCDSPK
jgi:hypothetical protein